MSKSVTEMLEKSRVRGRDKRALVMIGRGISLGELTMGGFRLSGKPACGMYPLMLGREGVAGKEGALALRSIDSA